MRSWELSKNIIAFFQSYSLIDSTQFSFSSTLISKNYQLYRLYHSSYDNPEVKSDPFEIVEEIILFLKLVPDSKVFLDLQTNIDYINEPRHKVLFETYIIPMIHAINNYSNILEYRELDLDLFSLQGLYDDKHRSIIPDTVNTVIYI